MSAYPGVVWFFASEFSPWTVIFIILWKLLIYKIALLNFEYIFNQSALLFIYDD